MQEALVSYSRIMIQLGGVQAVPGGLSELHDCVMREIGAAGFSW